MIIITVLEKASQRRPLSRQLSDKLWVCERWPLQGAMKMPWDGQCVDGNVWLHNKVSLGIIGSSLENYALRLNVMIQGWSLKTELWYVFLFNVIIHIKKMLKSFMINIIVTSFRILEDNYDTLWEKKHFFRKSQTGLFKHSFLTSGHVSLMFIIDFLGHDKRWCLETNMYWFKTWVRFDSKVSGMKVLFLVFGKVKGATSVGPNCSVSFGCQCYWAHCEQKLPRYDHLHQGN